ncbi:DEAD/DEAH box helicase family protein [Cocleimonas sp. KMM 6892]|uniref:DEAD/DEAH box helicase family protein n=1 Tax=unclassified Cocleimonas TaxID=2639732 RepID=UPI002DBE8406|nr:MULTISPECIES: DEAD/DEAH box helicase family protein [unclassified Cocleimonas]MEB8434537.1 DEAD/DEAH box helicase family protein [Cocleimonas sp. KMM 6892]MEC4717430.1 DEAD/DEAH box helicase family protein [Cocleimonas sp. KMM 6895]MEC4746776.1 DEAD/DEAH box helicase family protein [Cocleimonas sp. KMM 6896]
MNASTADLSFIHPWRPEQLKVLSRLNDYMEDKRVHIVAAPGAGKTVLGLEIFNRLNVKTLTLSPTVLIKDQWIERLSLFIDSDESVLDQNNSVLPDWVSSVLDEPEYFTSTTYQALYSFDKQLKKKQIESPANQKYDLQQWFRSQKFGLIILDEAHHLKASWWAVLYDLVKDNDDLIVVSLTATPPYDSNTTEWSRYKKLCGPVDEEISIPELVKSRSLCPHQDYIWLVKTDEKNIQSLERYEDNLKTFLAELTTNDELNYQLLLHEFLVETEGATTISERELLLNIETVIALLQLLKHWQKPLPLHLLQALDISADDIPPLTVNNWQTLIESFMQGDYYPKAEPVESFRHTLTALLKRKRYLKYNQVQFDNTQSKIDAFNKTEERISACYEIAKIEIANRKSLLRMVVLADYIRDEELALSIDTSAGSTGVTTGAYPIFHHFIHKFDGLDDRDNRVGVNGKVISKIALLTGRLCILSSHLVDTLFSHIPSHAQPTIKAFSEHKDFVVCGGATSYLSAAYTRLLEAGDLQIIVGTRALLGEGWDAPFLNALVMATQTRAYVATNQLRGRVMRVDPQDDFKTASIWHIVATAPEKRLNGLIFENLQKRFRTFAGLHAYDLKIESGTERLSLRTIDEIEGSNVAENELKKEKLPEPKQDVIQTNNQIMQTRLTDDLFNLQARWQNALAKAKHQVFQVGLHHQVDDHGKLYSLERLLTVVNERRRNHGNKYKLTALGLMGLGSAVTYTLFNSGFSGYAYAFGGSAGGAVSFALIKAKGLNDKRNSIDIGQKIAKVILLSLHNKGVMKTALQRDKTNDVINICFVDNGILRFSLNDYTRQENENFLEVLNEFLQPLGSSRYLLALYAKPAIQDLFSIPKLIGNNKSDANDFLAEWRRVFPEFKKANLITGNSIAGEKLLIRASAERVLKRRNVDTPLQMIERWE